MDANARKLAVAAVSALLPVLTISMGSAERPLWPLPTPDTPPPVPALLQNYKPVTATQLTNPGRR
jgi:hypothetical protein